MAIQNKESESPGAINRIANTSVKVQAPMARVWDVAITGMAHWKNWNTAFDAKINEAPAVGVQFHIESFMPGAPFEKTVTPMKMSKLNQTEGVVCWRMNDPWMLSVTLW